MKATNWKTAREQATQTGRIDEAKVAVLKDGLLAEVRAYKLAELRAAMGLSQAELAKKLDVSQSRISRIEHGELDKTELATLRKFAQALGGEVELTLRVGDERYLLG